MLGGGEPHLMVTDPPYGIEYDAGWRASAPITRRRTDGVREVVGGRAIGKVKNDDRADWGEAWVLFPGDVAYVWHASTHVSEVQDSLLSAGFVVRAHLIWAKSVMVIGRGHYHYQHEPCWYAVRKGKTAHWAGDRTQTTVWQIDKNQSSETGHSTQKRPNTSPLSRARAPARAPAGNQRPWPADKVERYLSGTAVLEYGPTEILPPVSAQWRAWRVSTDPIAKPAAQTRAEKRGSRPSKAAAGERLTVCWREMDSNHRSPDKKEPVFVAEGELRDRTGAAKKACFLCGNRWFESISLQRRVSKLSV